MSDLTQPAWDDIWQRFYDRSVVLGMSPNRAVVRATDETTVRFGDRPGVTAARSET